MPARRTEASPNVLKLAGLTISIELADKAVAQEWLTHNTKNRNLRSALVQKYARDLAGGRWHQTGDPIQFDKTGRLLNGQNRLTALVIADVTIPMLVIRGLESECQRFMDIGSKRTVADALKLDDVPNAGRLSTAAGFLFMHLNGTRPTHAEVLELIQDEPDLDVSAQVGERLKRALGGSGGLYAVAFHVLADVDLPDANRFFEGLVYGDSLTRGSPILALRNRLLANTGPQVRDPSTLSRNLAMFFRSWNYWRRGKPLSMVKLSSTIQTPK